MKDKKPKQSEKSRKAKNLWQKESHGSEWNREVSFDLEDIC